MYRINFYITQEGVTGEWRGAWVMLVRRVLAYYTAPLPDTGPNMCTVDLRKTRCVGKCVFLLQGWSLLG